MFLAEIDRKVDNMNTIAQLEQEQITKIMAEGKKIPEFSPGDTLRVNVKVVEGQRTRIQAFEGVCIARSNKSINSNFTVRKISYGEGVERVFPLYSPNVKEISIIRRGDVRRAKLYYLRGRTGKAARIPEKRVFSNKIAKKQPNAQAKSNKEEKITDNPISGNQ